MNYRKSHYSIEVKLDKADNKYMLVHSYTGAIDIVNGELVEYLGKTEEFGVGDFPFSRDTFDLLAKRGHITQKTFEEEQDHVRRLANLLHKEFKKDSKQYLFMVTYDCNFRCAYCYEGGISKQGSQWSGKIFTKEMVDRAYQAMEEMEPNKDKRVKRITLYGGEPLLRDNVGIVGYIIEKGIAFGYDFDVITNGHDLAYYESIFANGAIKRLQITLDGTPDTHNLRRYHYQTGDSFDIIFRNIGLALDYGILVVVRSNVDAKNFEEIEKLKQFFDEVGYSKQKNFSFYTALVTADENTADENSSLIEVHQKENNLAKEDGAEYLSRKEFNTIYQEAGLTVSRQDYGLYKQLTTAIHNGTPLRVRPIFCAVGTNMYIFDPHGNLYNCWETVGIKKHILGNYSEGVVFFDEREKWRDRNVGNTPKCNACKYSLLCGGGCLAKALRFGGGFDKSYCNNYRDMFRLSVNMVFENWQERQTKAM